MMATRGYLVEGTAVTHKDTADLFKGQLGLCSALRWVEETFAPSMEALATFENEYVLLLIMAV